MEHVSLNAVPGSSRNEVVDRLTRAFMAIVDETPAGVSAGGAALAVWQDGKPLLSLHGGEAAAGRAWTAATPCLIWSASKGVAAACTLHALQEKRIPLHTAVAKLWPEFAAAGKDQITLGQLLSHQAGLAAIDQRGLAITDHATLAGIVYICFIPESVTRRTTAMKETTPEASAAPSKNVIGRVVNFVTTGNRVLYDAMK